MPFIDKCTKKTENGRRCRLSVRPGGAPAPPPHAPPAPPNVALYQSLAERLPLQLIASGGVSSLEELRRLKALGLYGAILGKALYTGALSLRGALGEVE